MSQVPHLINYQGRISVEGTNFDGSGLFKFALVSADGTQVFWMNSPDFSPADGEPDSSLSLSVTKGLYNVALGDISVPGMAAIPAAAFANSGVYLRVWFSDGVHGWSQMAPDQRVAAVAYAMMAETVPDGSITDAKLAVGAVGSVHLASGAVTAEKIAAGAVTAQSIGAETPESAQSRVDALASSFAAGGMSSLKAMLEEARRDACIHIISDSTNAGGAWSGPLVNSIRSLYPQYTIKTTSWVPPGNDWSAPVTVQNGTGNGGGERRWEFPAGAQFTPLGYPSDFPMPAGDLDIRVKVRIDNASATYNTLFSKWSDPTSRGFSFAQDAANNSRRFWFVYTVDGVNGFNHFSTVGVGANGIVDGTPYWARVTVDVDNGSGGKTITFYTSTDGNAWTQLGDPVITNSSGVLPLGGANGLCSLGGQNGTVRMVGAVYAGQIRSGINGPVIHPMNLDAWCFNEGAARLAGAPELWISNAAYSGASVSTFLGTPDLIYCRNYSPQIILISLSHNSPRETGNFFIGKMKTMISKVRAVYGDIPRIIFLTQNPQLRTPTTNDPNNHHVDARLAHRAEFMSWASGSGYGVIDTWAAFEADPRPMELLVGTNAWADRAVTSMSGDGGTVTVNVNDIYWLAQASNSRVAIVGAKNPDGSPSAYNGAYTLIAKSGNTTGPGWVTYSSSVTGPVDLSEAKATPCDAIHPSAEGYKVWAQAVFAAFKRGIP